MDRIEYRDVVDPLRWPSDGPSPTTVAYTAGILDGEGSISLVLITNRRTKSGRPATAPKLVVQVSSTSKALIEWLVATWRAGSVIPSRRPRKPNHAPAWGWRVRGPSAVPILQEVVPYLVIKRAQAELALRYQALIVPCRKLGDDQMIARMGMRDEMIALNGGKHRAIPWRLV